MNTQNIMLTINAVTVIALLLSIIYTAGVVWRVEKELDISYKFFLAAIVVLFVAEAINLYYPIDNALYIALTIKILRMLFALCFLIGILFMRDIARKLDGEKEAE